MEDVIDALDDLEHDRPRGWHKAMRGAEMSDQPRQHPGWQFEPEWSDDEPVEDDLPRMFGEDQESYEERLARIREHLQRSELARRAQEFGGPRRSDETGLIELPEDDDDWY